MTIRNIDIDKFVDYFESKESFGLQDIKDYFQRFKKDISRTTLDWWIYELKQRGILYRVGRGLYSFQEPIFFNPSIEKELIKLHGWLVKEFPYLDLCIWHSKWVNQFMVHQIGRFYILIEVEKEAVESVFYYLKEREKDVFLNPSSDILYHYANAKESIIVKPLISEAPINKQNKIPTASLEKILVDLVSDEIFEAYQGAELDNILENAFSLYSINEPKLLRYASRRKRKKYLLTKIEKTKQLIKDQ